MQSSDANLLTEDNIEAAEEEGGLSYSAKEKGSASDCIMRMLMDLSMKSTMMKRRLTYRRMKHMMK